FFDRDGYGTTVLGGIHRWRLESNWKVPAENQAGDVYHPDVSHAAVHEMGGVTIESAMEPAMQVVASTGHTMLVRTLPDDSDGHSYPGGGRIGREWFDSIQPEVRARLGETRARLGIVAGTLFPNLGVVPSLFSLRVWHPRGPNHTEIWSYCIVPAAA